MRLGINGFGRIGRLALRAAFERDDIEVVVVNEPFASAEVLATLLEFDSVQGRWQHACRADAQTLVCGSRPIPVTTHSSPADIPWREHEVDMVLECSGKFRKVDLLQAHFDQGARRVLVSAPVGEGIPDIVMGVNHDAFDLAQQTILTAASCTTNCLAPVVRVLHDAIGIQRGLVTTIHNPTNTQRVHDAPHRDARRARAAQLSLIPTSTNSAVAVTRIIPELDGRLDSVAVRAPVLNASITDAVFQVERTTTVQEVNRVLRDASTSDRLKGVLGYETRPLVSADFAGDPRSAVIDAQSTRVTDGSLVKILAWYDNEWGYANRMVELAALWSRS